MEKRGAGETMAFEDAESKVREIAERVAASSGLEVVEVELRGGSGKGGRSLRVFIEKNEEGRRKLAEQVAQAEQNELKIPTHVSLDQLAGVTHDDLESFSRELSTILDVEDPIPGGAYTLEVSSPGLDRKLRRAADYSRFSGSLVKFSTVEPVNGNRHWSGRIQSVGDKEVTFLLEQKKRKPGKGQEAETLSIPFDNIEKAQLVPEV
jgi:ribosome maturation factor RimP